MLLHHGGTWHEPDIALGLLSAFSDACNIAQKHWLALADANHQITHVFGVAQKFTRLHIQHLCPGALTSLVNYGAGRHPKIGSGQRPLQAQRVNCTFAHAARVKFDLNGAARAAQRLHFPHTGHGLYLGFNRVGHGFQIHGGLALLAPQRDRDHRHIVDAFGFDDGRQSPGISGHPILVGVQYIKQPHQRLGMGHADLELHRQNSQSGASHRIRVFNAGYLTQHLFSRTSDHVLHIGTAGARKRDHHVGHGHVDLGLFLAGRDKHGKGAQ